MAPLAAERSIQIIQHCACPALAVQADRQRFSQVLVNLISNAIKYNHQGGTITISCHEGGTGGAAVVVSDTGPGISAENIERIFVPFERLGSEQTSVEGTGIGLVVNHAMLYIEDNENNISLVQALLKRRPQIELHIAMTGRDGVQATIDQQPGLILLDNRLPDATGAEVLSELASAAATEAIPVVMLSSDSDEILDELLASGATESVAKPFDIHQFMDIIDRYLP